MAEIVVRPMEVKGQSQEPVRVFCENGANLLPVSYTHLTLPTT